MKNLISPRRFQKHTTQLASEYPCAKVMAISGYTLIPVKAITRSITCWAVKAQINRLWKTVEHANGNAIRRFEMILLGSHIWIYCVYWLFVCLWKLWQNCICALHQIETSIRKDIWNLLSLNMEERQLYMLHNVSVLRNDVDFHFANH